jgi:hypothetical protein
MRKNDCEIRPKIIHEQPAGALFGADHSAQPEVSEEGAVTVSPLTGVSIAP